MAQIDLKYVIGINALSANPTVLATSGSEAHLHDSDCEHDHDHGKITHHGITSMQVLCGRLSPAQVQRLDEWIRTVLWEGHLPTGLNSHNENHVVEVLRCKGTFATQDGEQYVLQGVRSMYEMTQIEGKSDLGLPDEGKLVFIGKGLDETARANLIRAIS